MKSSEQTDDKIEPLMRTPSRHCLTKLAVSTHDFIPFTAQHLAGHPYISTLVRWKGRHST